MQYKSARPCFSIFFNQKVFVTAVAFAVSLLASSFAHATITPTPISKKANSYGSLLKNSVTGTYFYPFYINSAQDSTLTNKPAPVPSTGVLDPLFSYLDLGTDPNPSADPSTQDSVIYFQVSSDKTSFSTNAFLVATMTQANSSTAELVPIIGTNNGAGNVVGCNGNCSDGPGGQPGNIGGSNFYYLVPFGAGQTVTVAISPTAMCESMQQVSSGTVNSICTSPFFSTTSGAALPAVSPAFTFTFAIYLSTDFTAAPVTTPPTNAAQDSIALNLQFENLNPVPATPSPTPTETCELTQDGVYTPYQGGFQLSATPSQFFQVPNDPAGTIAGLNQLITIASLVPTPLASTAATYTQNSIVLQPFLFSSTAPVVGFQPDDSNRDFQYTLGFLSEDASGYIFDDGGNGSCTFPHPFDTSTVQGFLNQSKCFIATAAFRDLNSTPLVLLRAFRDQFLEKFSLGRSFVHWYYAWSPDAAEWLIDHPVFRFPVLLALIPLQALAWLVLHPLIMMILMLMAMSMILWTSRLRRSPE